MTNENKNIFEKIMSARLKFLNSNPKKSGYNKFQNFKYFELVDIVPIATKICCELGLYTHIFFEEETAIMLVINVENPKEKVEYRIPAPTVREDKFNSMLQDTGRAETYLRRYLYMLFLDITENDSVDAADQTKNGNGFKTAIQYKQKSKPKSNARKKAEGIIQSLEIQNKEVTLLNAKIQMMEYFKKGEIQEADCDKILKELEVLLNGSSG